MKKINKRYSKKNKNNKISNFWEFFFSSNLEFRQNSPFLNYTFFCYKIQKYKNLNKIKLLIVIIPGVDIPLRENCEYSLIKNKNETNSMATDTKNILNVMCSSILLNNIFAHINPTITSSK